jgi:hypothetical protein
MTVQLAGEWIESPKWDPRWEPVAVREYTADELNAIKPNYVGGVHAALHAEALVLANRLGLDDDIRIDRVDTGYRNNVQEGITVTFYRWVT